MIIIGVDYHPEFQQLASVDTETGEFKEARLQNPEQAEQFYRELAARGAQVRIGMEASGHARWLERLLAELHLSCGLEMRTRSVLSECVSKRRTDKMHS